MGHITINYKICSNDLLKGKLKKSLKITLNWRCWELSICRMLYASMDIGCAASPLSSLRVKTKDKFLAFTRLFKLSQPSRNIFNNAQLRHLGHFKLVGLIGSLIYQTLIQASSSNSWSEPLWTIQLIKWPSQQSSLSLAILLERRLPFMG